MKNFIYVVISENGLFKIGETSSVKKRVCQIKSGSPCQVEQFFWFEGSVELEKQLHNAFDEKRVRGEWFALDKTDLQNIVSMGKDNIPQKNREYITKLLDELEQWGFFKLGIREKYHSVQQAAIWKCGMAMVATLPPPY